MTSHPRRLTPPVLVALASLVAAGCATDAAESTSAPDTSGTAATATEGQEPASADAADGGPVTVANCGVEVTIEAPPQQMVAVEGAAETLFALGLGDRVAGWFGGEVAGMPEAYRAEAEQSERLGGGFPAPTLEAVIGPDPDLVVLYGYYPEADVTRERLDELGIPSLVLSESCPDSDGSTLEDYFDDVLAIGTATGTADTAEELVDGWRSRVAEATEAPLDGEPVVYVHGNPEPAEPFASGGGSLANDQIALAGGTNAFADEPDAFLSPSWEEVASRSPEIIVDGSGGGEESLTGLREYLTADPALATMPAVADDRFLLVDFEENVPGPRAVDGVVRLADYLRDQS